MVVFTSGIVDVCRWPGWAGVLSTVLLLLWGWVVEPGRWSGRGGGWHTVGCLRDQMPLLPELVLIFLGGGWVGFWACYRLDRVGLFGGCIGGWVWFVNSGREHLVAIREVK